MLFQKEKEDKNQINRLDQKRERRSRRAFFLLSPISRKTLSGKVSLCTFLKKASLTLETAMALPLFFFGVLTLLSFMDIYKVQTERSHFLSKGPEIAQSCGTATCCHALPSREKSHDDKVMTFLLCAWHIVESARARVMKVMLLLIILLFNIFIYMHRIRQLVCRCCRTLPWYMQTNPEWYRWLASSCCKLPVPNRRYPRR